MRRVLTTTSSFSPAATPSVKLSAVQETVSLEAPFPHRRARLLARARAISPSLADWGLALASAFLLILSFPDFELWPLAWIGLAPLFVAVARQPRGSTAFLLGWIGGTAFFYGSCYWLTYPMIHFGGVPVWLAYPLLVPPALVIGLFPALFCLLLWRAQARWGARALFFAPLFWPATEWARLETTGQLWNAIGYSQAYVPALIQAARFGGVYAVGSLIVAVNAALAYALLTKSGRALAVAAGIVAAVALTVLLFALLAPESTRGEPSAVVIAVQPNVDPKFERTPASFAALYERHLRLSAAATAQLTDGALPRVIIWPESPMNFSYALNPQFRATLAQFAHDERAAVLFNSIEPTPADGAYNSATLVNEEGRLVAQYDKIRLMPFGEYVPLPRWLPGASLVTAIVGEYTPGAQFRLVPLGPDARAGVFICYESAFPYIARRFAQEGADVLVNITNDAYQGPTGIMRQHLANSVFRAVENNRPLLRVANTGITAYITPRGEVRDATAGFTAETRVWTIERATSALSFYARRGDLFVYACAILSLLVAAATLRAVSNQLSAFSFSARASRRSRGDG